MSETAQLPDVKRIGDALTAYNQRPIRVIFVDGYYSVVHALHNSAAVEKAKLRHPGVDVVNVEAIR